MNDFEFLITLFLVIAGPFLLLGLTFYEMDNAPIRNLVRTIKARAARNDKVEEKSKNKDEDEDEDFLSKLSLKDLERDLAFYEEHDMVQSAQTVRELIRLYYEKYPEIKPMRKVSFSKKKVIEPPPTNVQITTTELFRTVGKYENEYHFLRAYDLDENDSEKRAIIYCPEVDRFYRA